MNEEIIKMLEELIKNEIDDLNNLNSNSDEKAEAIDNLTRLYKLKIEDSKIAMEQKKEMEEQELKRKQLEQEETSRKEQLAEQGIDRYVKIGIASAELLLPLIFYGVWMKRGFEFEKDGIFTSKTFMGLINRFRPTK